MEDILEMILDNVWIVFAIAFSLLTAIAVIRSVLKVSNCKKSIRYLGVALMIILCSCLFGCGETAKEPIDTSGFGELPPELVKEAPEPPGKLVGVTYEYSAGSMEYHTEFAIDLTPEEIVHCEYWGESSNEMTRKDNEPIKETQWEDVEKAVLDLMGKFKEVPEADESVQEPDPDLIVLDGGGYNRWYLTWETEEGTERVQYYTDSDRRFVTLTDLLYNLADGGNRKITWYDSPELASATYINDETGMSFQCTLWDGENSGYRFIVRFGEGDDEVKVDEHVDDRIWEAARPAFSWIDLDSLEDGSYMNPVCLNVTYTDQSYKAVTPDKEIVDIIEPYLQNLTLDYLEKYKSEE